MITKLLVCEKGFLDSEEHIPVKNSDMEKTGEFDGRNLTEDQIRQRVKDMGAWYFTQPRQGGTVTTYKHRSESDSALMKMNSLNGRLANEGLFYSTSVDSLDDLRDVERRLGDMGHRIGAIVVREKVQDQLPKEEPIKKYVVYLEHHKK